MKTFKCSNKKVRTNYTHKKETGTQRDSQCHKHIRKCVYMEMVLNKKCCIDQWNNEMGKQQRMETKNTKSCTKTLKNQCNKKQ